MVQFILNNEEICSEEHKGLTVLDFVRYRKHLTGTKIGCREGDCGACTILVGSLVKGKMQYQNMTSCIMPLANADGKHIVTIEGINVDGLNPAQQAMVEEGGTQCGFCTVGFIVSMTGYSLTRNEPSYSEMISSIDGNICRCTGYKSIERACQQFAKTLQKKPSQKPIHWLVTNNFLPSYFIDIPKRLRKLNSSLLEQKTNHIPVGGGTDLYVQRPEEMVEKKANYLFNENEFKRIYSKGEYVYIGAEATVTDILESAIMIKLFPSLADYMKLVSSTPIRNMGTIAGNFVNASPIGDLTIFFLALNSELILFSKGKERQIALNKFYLGYKKLNKKKVEIIHWIRFKKPSKQHVFNFEKVSKRTHLDIASVNSAIQIQVQRNKIIQAHVSIGGTGAIPTYLVKTGKYLQNKTLTPSLISEAKEVLNSEISPISDARGSADYKRLLARQLFYAHFIELFPEIYSLQKLAV